MNGSAFYEIGVRGQLGREWSSWFEGMDVAPGVGGTTVLRGALRDQAALHGVLAKIRDLGLTLVWVAEADGVAQK
jgi:hypothetical protein